MTELRQTRLFTTKRLAFAGLILIGVMGLLGLRLLASNPQEPILDSATPVAVLPIKLQDGYDSWRSYTGRGISARTSAMAFELAGTIEAVAVDLGSEVKKGDVLASLDTDRLILQKNQLLAEQQELAASLELAEQTLTRIQKTFDSGHTSAQRLDESRANVQMTKARTAQIASALSTVDLNITRSALRAPFDGTITARMMDEGGVVDQGSAVIQIAETGQMEAEIGMSASDARALRAGGSYQLYDAFRRPVKGDYRSIVSVMTGSTRTVKAVFNLAPGAVLDGELVHLRVPQYHLMQGAWVPVRAMSADVRGLWRVYKIVQVGGKSKVTYENVQLLYTDGQRAYVTGSISGGDTIVAGGVDRLAAGQFVSVVEGRSAAGASQ